MIIETTTIGMEFTWDLAGSQGASFILYPTDAHTTKEVKEAKQELRDSRDVVSIRVASTHDLVDRFNDAIFSHPDTKKLKWYEINNEFDVLRKAMKKGITTDDYVKNDVLPNVKVTKKMYLAKHGKSIYAI